MATISKENVVMPYNNKIPFPQDRFLCQFIEEKFAPSQKGAPMVTIEAQVVAPEAVEVNGAMVNVAGTRYMYLYFPLKVKSESGEGWDEEKTKKAQGRYLAFLDAMGIDTSNVDDEKPLETAAVKGMYADLMLGSDEQEYLKAPTPEQKAKNQPGSPVLDANNKPIKQYRPKIVSVLGRAEKPSAGPAV